jgi:hypothetical protein
MIIGEISVGMGDPYPALFGIGDTVPPTYLKGLKNLREDGTVKKIKR